MFTKASVEAYFSGEKQESLVFIIIGAIAIIAAIALLAGSKQPFWKGFAIPLVVIGLLQVVVGYTVYSRADDQRKTVVYNMDINPQALQQKELPRMQKVMQNFVLYRWVEIVLVIAGVAGAFYLRQKPASNWWYGLCVALALQAAIMLVADYFAEKRGAAYHTGLQQWLKV